LPPEGQRSSRGVQHRRQLALPIAAQEYGVNGAIVSIPSPWGTFISNTMMVMMMAITPSLNDSSRFFPMRNPLALKGTSTLQRYYCGWQQEHQQENRELSRNEYPACDTPIHMFAAAAPNQMTTNATVAVIIDEVFELARSFATPRHAAHSAET
jgi:hypothetical protein